MTSRKAGGPRVLNIDSEPQVAGGLLLARLEYLRHHGGSALVERVLAQLAPADAAVLRGPILPVSWYPRQLHLGVDEAIVSLASPGDRADVLVGMGRASADAILDGTQFIKHGVPQFFLEAVPRLYSAHHTVGRRAYAPLGENGGIIRTFEAERLVTPDDCWTAVGWLQRGLELSGAEAVLVTETICRASGAPCCEYRCEWHGPAAPPV